MRVSKVWITSHYPLVMTNSLLLKMAIEIVDLPICIAWWFSSSLCNSLPEGNHHSFLEGWRKCWAIAIAADRKPPDACATSHGSWRPTSWCRWLNHGGFDRPIRIGEDWIRFWLVVWNIWIIFPYIGNNDPNWRTHIFQRGRYTTNQDWFGQLFENEKTIWKTRKSCQKKTG